VADQLVLPGLESIRRPDGRLYRPRKINGHALSYDDDDWVTGVLILGTHDVARAQVLADDCAARWVGRGFVAVRPETGWYRDGFEYGRRCWRTAKEDLEDRTASSARFVIAAISCAERVAISRALLVEEAPSAACLRCGAALVRDELGAWVRRDEPERGRGICRKPDGSWEAHALLGEETADG
jgi:hypothetical protein